ncbi:MAG: hypothetical protein JJU00_18565 [Opitutales bacterium]|nr:hypothetical protein [Opitutales bacterium]
MKRALLDVNVLIALFDADHAFNESAHGWLEANASVGIATCPLTENGLVRILSHPRYSKTLTLRPADVIDRLERFAAHHDHEFWADELSLRETVIRRDRILGSRQLTDIYLLGFAVRRNGRLVTFDQTIPVDAVEGATPAHLVALR